MPDRSQRKRIHHQPGYLRVGDWHAAWMPNTIPLKRRLQGAATGSRPLNGRHGFALRVRGHVLIVTWPL